VTSKRIKYARITTRMVYSQAFQNLNAPELKILSYILLQQQWKKISRSKYVLENKDDFQLLYSVFKKPPFKMNPNTISKSISTLLSHGFIKVFKQGGKVKGDNSVYGFSESWQKWRPGDVIFKREPFYPRGFTKR